MLKAALYICKKLHLVGVCNFFLDIIEVDLLILYW